MNIDCRRQAKIETHLEFKIATVKASFEPICLQALPSVESNFRSFSSSILSRLLSFLGQIQVDFAPVVYR